MHRMEQFLEDCIEYTECHMASKSVAEMSPWEKEYITNCCELCLKVLAVIAGKKLHDRHMIAEEHTNAHHNMTHNPNNINHNNMNANNMALNPMNL